MSLLDLKGVSARVGGRLVLDGVDLAVRPGERVALTGVNGAGKTTLLRAALGLQRLDGGEARLGGQAVAGLSARERAVAASYLPQERRIAWNMPALEVAALGTPFLSGAEGLKRARAALDQVEAGHLADRGVAEMSGGERARVLLARALVSDAPLILADEPVAGLDPDAQRLVLEVLARRAGQGGAAVASLHDLTLAAGWADRVVVLKDGRVIADGPPMQALAPDMLAEAFRLDGRWTRGLLDARRLA